MLGRKVWSVLFEKKFGLLYIKQKVVQLIKLYPLSCPQVCYLNGSLCMPVTLKPEEGLVMKS